MSTQHVEDAHEVVLVSGLCAELIDERLRNVCRLADVGHRATAFYLADLHTRGLHAALGMPTTVTYAVRSLGMSRRQARELLDAGLRLPDLCRIDAAFAERSLSWSRVRRLCEVATPATEVAWLERAMTGTQDELDRLVRRAHRGDAPPSGDGLPRARFALHIELDELQWQMWENARAKLLAELPCGDELRDADIATEMLRLVLASDADGSVPGRKAVEGGAFRVVAEEREAASDPRIEALVSEAATPPWLRTKVLTRDGHACLNCGSRRALHAHHVVFRSRGGPTAIDNLATTCNRCHSLVHSGFLDVEVAQCAAGDPRRVAFTFHDMHGRRVDRRVLTGARVALHGVAVGAATEVAAAALGMTQGVARHEEVPAVEHREMRGVAQGAASGAAPLELDVRWLAARLDWFDVRGGRFVLRAQFRERFELEMAARQCETPAGSAVG